MDKHKNRNLSFFGRETLDLFVFIDSANWIKWFFLKTSPWPVYHNYKSLQLYVSSHVFLFFNSENRLVKLESLVKCCKILTYLIYFHIKVLLSDIEVLFYAFWILLQFSIINSFFLMITYHLIALKLLARIFS